jgi:hypothetical protein
MQTCRTMPLDPEFKQHLHSLMVEIYNGTVDENERFKRECIGQARHSPSAYIEAALHATENRISKTIAKYLEAVSIWGFEITPTFEKDMISEFIMLTAGPNRIQLPPMMHVPQISAIQAHYGRERSKLANKLVREGTNRLRELKMKSRLTNQGSGNTTINNAFNAPIGNAYINSKIEETTHFAVSASILQDIERISVDHPELQAAATELAKAPQGGSKLQRLTAWIGLANSVTGLAEKIHQQYPHLEAVILSLKHLA